MSVAIMIHRHWGVTTSPDQTNIDFEMKEPTHQSTFIKVQSITLLETYVAWAAFLCDQLLKGVTSVCDTMMRVWRLLFPSVLVFQVTDVQDPPTACPAAHAIMSAVRLS